MKTLRKEPITLFEFDGYAPKVECMQPNTLYYSEQYETALHLCLCGCGQQIVTPIDDINGWRIVRKDKLTMTPSLQHMNGCKSHYIITDGVANFV